MPPSTDRIGEALQAAALRISKQYFELLAGRDATFELRVARRRDWRRAMVVEGLELRGALLADDPRPPGTPDIFVPVRRRRVFASRWHDEQAVVDAAATAGETLRRWAYELRADEAELARPVDDRRPPPL